jgi:membrane-associated phospholipid phosphatase
MITFKSVLQASALVFALSLTQLHAQTISPHLPLPSLQQAQAERSGFNPPEGDGPCVSATAHDFGRDMEQVGSGLKAAPRNAVRLNNLAWELPIAAATGVLISSVDTPAARRVRSQEVAQRTNDASNVLVGVEIVSAGALWASGCLGGHSHARRAGFTALTATGTAVALDELLKLATNREYPTTDDARGRFWHGGKSFASGHAAASWAFAAAIAHAYPEKRWLKWTVYATAASVSILRFPAQKHFPSDILVGSTIGFVTGAYLGSHVAQ